MGFPICPCLAGSWPREPSNGHLAAAAATWATELDRLAGGGEPGLFLANYLTSLALQAEVLGATSAADHSTKAAIEAERESCWLAALEAAAAASDDQWVTSSEPDPQATGALSGHPADDSGPMQAWLGDPSQDDTYMN